MKKIVFTVEKGKTGYGAYCKYENNLITTMADTIEELHANMIEAYNLAADENNWPEITIDNLQ